MTNPSPAPHPNGLPETPAGEVQGQPVAGAMKHTPGPCDVGDPKRDDEFYGVSEVIKRNHPNTGRTRVLATCNGNFPAEAAANAMLYAAAPDHHQNAIWADNIFSQFEKNPAFREILDYFGYVLTFDAWMEANRAAIAKAKGV